MAMTDRKRELLEKQIKRMGGIRNYVNCLRRSFRADARSGLLRAEGTSNRKCAEMLKELDKMEARLNEQFPHLANII